MTQEGYLISGGTRLEALLASLDPADVDSSDAADVESVDSSLSSVSTACSSSDVNAVDAATMAFPVPMRARMMLDEFRIGEGGEEESEDITEIWVLGQDGVIVTLGPDGYWRDSLGRLARGPR